MLYTSKSALDSSLHYVPNKNYTTSPARGRKEARSATCPTFSLFGAGFVLTLGLDRVALVMQQGRGGHRRRCRQEVVRVRMRMMRMRPARARNRDLAVVGREGGREAERRRQWRRRLWRRRGMLWDGDEGGLPRPAVASLHAEIGRLHRCRLSSIQSRTQFTLRSFSHC